MRESHIIGSCLLIANHGSEYADRYRLTSEEKEICNETLLRAGIPNLPSGGLPTMSLTLSQEMFVKATVHNLILEKIEEDNKKARKEFQEKTAQDTRDTAYIEEANILITKNHAIEIILNCYAFAFSNMQRHTSKDVIMKMATKIHNTSEQLANFRGEIYPVIDALILDNYTRLYKEWFDRVTVSKESYDSYKQSWQTGCIKSFGEQLKSIILKELMKGDEKELWESVFDPNFLCSNPPPLPKCWKLVAVSDYLNKEINKEIKDWEQKVLSKLGINIKN